MKDMPKMYKKVLNLLREGEENATTSRDISTILNIDRRKITGIIERLIVDHNCLIGSSRHGEHKGYYIISNADEFNKTANTFNRQIQSMLNRHRALIKAYGKSQIGN